MASQPLRVACDVIDCPSAQSRSAAACAGEAGRACCKADCAALSAGRHSRQASGGGEAGQACCKADSAAPSTGRHSRQASDGKPSSSFDCNICLDTALEPVITMCGHLYCWPCIYKWMEQRREEVPFCPICKADISPDRMIPIYGRGQARPDPRRRAVVQGPIPQRPAGQRGSVRPPSSPVNGPDRPNATVAAAGGHAGLSFLPDVLGFQFGTQPPGDGATEQLSPEQIQQAFLSRLLLLLGSFVILCLLLF